MTQPAGKAMKPCEDFSTSVTVSRASIKQISQQSVLAGGNRLQLNFGLVQIHGQDNIITSCRETGVILSYVRPGLAWRLPESAFGWSVQTNQGALYREQEDKSYSDGLCAPWNVKMFVEQRRTTNRRLPDSTSLQKLNGGLYHGSDIADPKLFSLLRGKASRNTFAETYGRRMLLERFSSPHTADFASSFLLSLSQQPAPTPHTRKRPSPPL
ncbi:hypothetical protein RRG08_049326 [Elysia crispata]|uniref:Uncharacterized protein n=1 Tax=Elysia crispata TaxID=231223 RepID=A0AAE0XDV3_9GAST|nr:hypothetical protein RRG08_049326 [Elysia crispata]